MMKFSSLQLWSQANTELDNVHGEFRDIYRTFQPCLVQSWLAIAPMSQCLFRVGWGGVTSKFLVLLSRNFAFSLGLTVDAHLSWNNHVDNLCGKLGSRIGVLYRSSKILPKHCLIPLYYSMIQSVIDYGLIIWDKHLNIICYVYKNFRIERQGFVQDTLITT